MSRISATVIEIKPHRNGKFLSRLREGFRHIRPTRFQSAFVLHHAGAADDEAPRLVVDENVTFFGSANELAFHGRFLRSEDFWLQNRAILCNALRMVSVTAT